MPNRKSFIIFAVLVFLAACTTTPPEPTSTPPPETTATPSPTVTPPPPTATFTPSPTPTITLIPPPTPPASTGPLRRVAGIEPVLFGKVIDFRLLPDGRLILTTTKGYATISGEDIFLQFAGYSKTVVGTDDQERMWFFLEHNAGKIYYWDGGLDFTLTDQGWDPIENFAELEGQGLITDSLGQIWLYTQTDVRMFNGQTWTIFDWEDLDMPVPPYDEISSNLQLFYLPINDQIWVSSCYWGGPGPVGGGGVRWFDGENWTGSGTGVNSGCVRSVVEDQQGRIWMGVEDILWRYAPNTAGWRSYNFPESTENQRVAFAEDIVIDSEGSPWVSFLLCGGASCGDYQRYHRQGASWAAISDVTFPPDTLLFDGDGIPWLFGKNVFRIENNQAILIADLEIHAVTVDAQGRIWLVATPWDGDIALWVLEGE